MIVARFEADDGGVFGRDGKRCRFVAVGNRDVRRAYVHGLSFHGQFADRGHDFVVCVFGEADGYVVPADVCALGVGGRYGDIQRFEIFGQNARLRVAVFWRFVAVNHGNVVCLDGGGAFLNFNRKLADGLGEAFLFQFEENGVGTGVCKFGACGKAIVRAVCGIGY